MGLLSSVSSFVGDLFGAEDISSSAAAGRDEAYRFSREARADLQPFREFGERQISGLESFVNPDPYGTAGSARLRGMVNPYGETTGSLQDLMLNPNQIKETPYYKFQLSEGLGALERSKLAKGKFFSGETSRDIIDYAEGLASTSYGDEFLRRFNLAGLQYGQQQGLYDKSYSQERDVLDREQNIYGSEFQRKFNLVGLGQASAAGQANVSTNLGNLFSQSFQTQGQDVASAGSAGVNLMAQLGAMYAGGAFGGGGMFGGAGSKGFLSK